MYISVPIVEYLRLLLTSQPEVKSARNWFRLDSSIGVVTVSTLMFCFALVWMSRGYKESKVSLDGDVLIGFDEVTDILDKSWCQRQECVGVLGKADLDELGFFVSSKHRLSTYRTQVASSNQVWRVAHIFVDSEL